MRYLAHHQLPRTKPFLSTAPPTPSPYALPLVNISIEKAVLLAVQPVKSSVTLALSLQLLWHDPVTCVCKCAQFIGRGGRERASEGEREGGREGGIARAHATLLLPSRVAFDGGGPTVYRRLASPPPDLST